MTVHGDTPEMAVVRRHLLGLWQDGDFALAETLFHADFVDHNPVAGQAPGPEGLVAAARMIKTAFPDQRYELLKLEQSGDIVIDHWILRATHLGPLGGHPPSGKPVEFRGTDMVRVKDGRIIEIWHVEELLKMYTQIGLLPPL